MPHLEQATRLGLCNYVFKMAVMFHLVCHNSVGERCTEALTSGKLYWNFGVQLLHTALVTFFCWHMRPWQCVLLL